MPYIVVEMRSRASRMLRPNRRGTNEDATTSPWTTAVDCSRKARAARRPSGSPSSSSMMPRYACVYAAFSFMLVFLPDAMRRAVSIALFQGSTRDAQACGFAMRALTSSTASNGRAAICCGMRQAKTKKTPRLGIQSLRFANEQYCTRNSRGGCAIGCLGTLCEARSG